MTVNERNIEKILEETKDGDVVHLVLQEGYYPRIIEKYTRKAGFRMVIRLEKTDPRGYGFDSSVIASLVGYYGGWYSGEYISVLQDTRKKYGILYPLCQTNQNINSSPPIRIEVPLDAICLFDLVQSGEHPVTPPTGFP